MLCLLMTSFVFSIIDASFPSCCLSPGAKIWFQCNFIFSSFVSFYKHKCFQCKLLWYLKLYCILYDSTTIIYGRGTCPLCPPWDLHPCLSQLAFPFHSSIISSLYSPPHHILWEQASLKRRNLFHMESGNGISILFCRLSSACNCCFEVSVTPDATCNQKRESSQRTAKTTDRKPNDR